MSLDHAESGTPTARSKPSQRNAEKQEGQKPNMSESVVQEQVMKMLGELPNLIRVQVRALWKGHYRANIYVGSDHLTSRIAHSFFIITDDAGKISEARPPIVRNRPSAVTQPVVGANS
jgi:hypothetical protein